jgi:hypothetical protein
MLNRRQELWIESRDPGKHFRIYLVTLEVALIDGAQFPSIGHKNLVTQIGDQATHPGGMRPYFQRHSSLLPSPEEATHATGGSPDAPFLEELSCCVQDEKERVLVTEIHANRHPREISATLVHGRPPSMGC